MLLLRPWISRPILVLAPVLMTALGASPASAAVVSFHGQCSRTADVIRWTPRNGAIARFVADTFASSTQTGLWIGLGRIETAFWSAEGGDPDDACDQCRTLYLVETKLDGTRTRHTVLGPADYQRIGSNTAARKAHVLTTLWKLANDTWPADKLLQDYTLATGKPPQAPPFIAEVTMKGKAKIRYDLSAKTSMCWCVYQWTAKKS